jgi:hypothetical protein
LDVSPVGRRYVGLRDASAFVIDEEAEISVRKDFRILVWDKAGIDFTFDLSNGGFYPVLNGPRR